MQEPCCWRQASWPVPNGMCLKEKRSKTRRTWRFIPLLEAEVEADLTPSMRDYFAKLESTVRHLM